MVSHLLKESEDVTSVAGPAWTEPGNPPGRGPATGIDHLTNESDGVHDKGICLLNGMTKIGQLYKCAVLQPRRPPIEGTGDNKVTREPNLSNVLNGGVEVSGGVIGIEVSEEARWLDGVVSGTG